MNPIEHRQPVARYSGVIAATICAVFAFSSLHAKSPVALTPNFSVYLAEGYRQMAAVATRAAADDRVVDYFRKRDAMALRGKLVRPQWPDPDWLDPSILREARFARKELVARLDGGGSPASAPTRRYRSGQFRLLARFFATATWRARWRRVSSAVLFRFRWTGPQFATPIEPARTSSPTLLLTCSSGG